MNRLEIDGVPVVWQEAPGPLSASLVFRVGRRDETFVTGGITHLVEHLAMAALPRTHLDCNASVDVAGTTFTATGRPEPVVEFLARVCEALTKLPTDRLGIEASVLRAEDGGVAHPAVSALLARRYGARAAGLAGFEEPAVTDLTALQVRAFAARFFVRGNAALTLTGPPPAGLRLPLPAGDQPSRAPTTPLPLPVPSWSEHPIEGVAVSLVGPDGEAFAAALRVLQARLEDDLRHTRGLVYAVEVTGALVGPDDVHASVWLDPKPADVGPVAREVVTAVRALAEKGPTDEEMTHDLEGFLEMAADPRSVVPHLEARAGDLLAGRLPRTMGELVETRRRVTAAEVRDAVRAALPSLYVLVPEDLGKAADLTAAAGLAREPGCLVAPVTGRTVKRRLISSAPWGARLTTSDEGLTLTYDDRVDTVRFADVVGVARYPDGYLHLLGVTGTAIPLSARDWKEGDELLALVRRQVPADLWYDAELDPED